jgi:putative hemolysin
MAEPSSHPDRTARGAETRDKLFDLRESFEKPFPRRLMSWLHAPIEKALRLDYMNDLYQQVTADIGEKTFFQSCLQVLRVSYSLPEEDLARIPAQGPLVVVANHPFGGIEGIMAGEIVSRMRPDTKIFGNYLLQQIPYLRQDVIPVDVFGGREARRMNFRSSKEAIQWLRAGHVLITFPAGEVAHFQWGQYGVADSAWNPNIAALIRLTQSAAIPMYFPGKNSVTFHLMGLVHPLLRTALIPRELGNKVGRRFQVYIGKPIPWRRLQKFDDDRDMIGYLRLKNDVLRNRAEADARRYHPRRFLRVAQPGRQEPVIPPVDSDLLRREVEALPPEARLTATDDYAVYLARADQIPHMLREIGRLRELTFRDVQEGTGKALDLDEFDQYYLHLFLWNRPQSELAGAYRLGLSDQILAQRGLKGLYTSTLFRFKRRFLEELDTVLELGRSFISSKYQREYHCLALLWKGIGQFIIRNPRYRVLLGPVSISHDYQAISKNLIIQYLRQTKLDSHMARYVKPRKRCWMGKVRTFDTQSLRSFLQNVDDVSLLISEIEKDGKGVPILLRHYLKLNATILCFNLDKKFSNVVDGLMLVDLAKTDPRLLRRFMGEEGYLVFARHHGLAFEPPAGTSRADEGED